MVTTVEMAENSISGMRKIYCKAYITTSILEELYHKSIFNRIFKIFSAISPETKKMAMHST